MIWLLLFNKILPVGMNLCLQKKLCFAILVSQPVGRREVGQCDLENRAVWECRSWWKGRRDLGGCPLPLPHAHSCSSWSNATAPLEPPLGSSPVVVPSQVMAPALLLLFVVRLREWPGIWVVQAHHFQVPAPKAVVEGGVWGEEGAAAL